jgi:hypothetical protein
MRILLELFAIDAHLVVQTLLNVDEFILKKLQIAFAFEILKKMKGKTT